MPTSTLSGGHRTGLAATFRTDAWWVEPLWTGAGFLLFVLYSTWAAFQGDHYFYGGYLSPFYSPLLFTDPTQAGAAPVEHALFGAFPEWLRAIWPPFFPTLARLAHPRRSALLPPHLLLLSQVLLPGVLPHARRPAPSGARPQRNYRGETALFLFQNLHRYTLYIAIMLVFILSYDAYLAFWRDGRFGIGVGTVVLILNAVLLATYTFGCHSFRHLIGGQLNCFTCDSAARTRYGVWQRVSWLNARHMLFAWLSLVWVGFADFYVRMVSMGYIHDLSTWG